MTVHIGWAQGILLALEILTLVSVGIKHGQPRDPYHFGHALINFAAAMLLLIWGGFFG